MAQLTQAKRQVGLACTGCMWRKSELVLVYVVHLLMHVFVLCSLVTDVLTKHRFV